jgi:hypothetical protein
MTGKVNSLAVAIKLLKTIPISDSHPEVYHDGRVAKFSVSDEISKQLSWSIRSN